jgi:hypothetical protein
MAARRSKIKEHTKYHDNYLERLAARITEQSNHGVVHANVLFDRSEGAFVPEQERAQRQTEREESFFEYDLVSFATIGDLPDLKRPLWLAEFTADDTWSRSKFFYEAWRWIWFSRAAAEHLEVPADAWVWRPGSDPVKWRGEGSLSAVLAQDPIPQKRALPPGSPLLYYTLPQTPLYSIWLEGVPAETHKENFEVDHAIPKDLNIKCKTPNGFESDMLGKPGIFGRVYGGTTKSRRGGKAKH